MLDAKHPPQNLEKHCLSNKVILITGAGSGIGRALSLEAAKQGATVVLLSKTLKRLESVYDEIVEAGYPEPAIQPMNLLQAGPDEIQVLASSIEDMFGRLDGIVHQAGTYGQICPLEQLPPHKWLEVIQLNLNLPYLLTHTLLPLLRKSQEGSIVFTVGSEAKQPKAYWSAYNTSQAGIVSLADTLSQELEGNSSIQVSCINPGKVRTAFRLNPYPGLDPNEFSAPQDIVQPYIKALAGVGSLKNECVDLAE